MKNFSMRNFVVCKLAVAALLAVAFQSCKPRVNGIDNNQVITKPYSLFIVDSLGKIDITNDGYSYRMAWSGDGSEARAITTADSNIIVVWSLSAHVAEDREISPELNVNLNFNPIGLPVNPLPRWQSMILNVPSHQRVYLAGNGGKGVIYSDSSGKRMEWEIDPHFDPAITGPVSITSFTQLKNGKLFGLDHINNRIFIKTGRDDAWQEKTMDATDKLPAGKMFLSHFNDILIAGDSSGANGVWYSNNDGVKWYKYSGIPDGAQIMCMNAPFDRVLLVGTAANGMFSLPLNSNTFTTANVGLNQFINIRAIAVKDDIYKNEKVVEYVYLATDFGIYRSIDLGKTWVLLRQGNYVAAY